MSVLTSLPERPTAIAVCPSTQATPERYSVGALGTRLQLAPPSKLRAKLSGEAVGRKKSPPTAIPVADQASGRPLTIDESRAVEAALRYFRESGPRHNSDEEQSLFPRLKDMPDVQAEIRRLAGEHQEADALHGEVAELFTAWLSGQTPSAEEARGLREMTHRLVELYHEHILVEEDHVFPHAARSLDSATLATIGREFQQRRA